MSRKKRIWLIVATCFTLFGAIIFSCVIAVTKGDFAKLSIGEWETNEYSLEETYNNVSVISDTADVTLVASDMQTTTVVCYEEKNAKHTVSVQNGELVIKVHNEKKWYENWFNFVSPKITVYMPKGAYGMLSVSLSTGDIQIPKDFQWNSIDISGSTGDVTCCASVQENVKIKQSTGDIRLSNLSAGNVDLTTSTGDITLSSVTVLGDLNIKVSTGDINLQELSCNNFVSDGNTGDVTLRKVVAKEKLTIKRSTGDIRIERCDANSIRIETDTGDVKGTLLSGKTFIVKTDTGKISVPDNVSGGNCEIITDTGDINISVE